MELNTPKIDSLRLLIPFNEVEVNQNHKEFLREITTINEDGEVINTKKNNTYRLHSNPCSCHYLYGQTIIQGKNVEVLKLGFSSKTLKTKYFDGINASNVDEIHKFILSENVIAVSKQTLLNARIVDTDICYDTLLKDSNVIDVISHAHKLSKPLKDTKVNAFKERKTNVGIEWSDRNKVGKAYKSKQYLKYYAKALELKNHSSKFYEKYLINNDSIIPYIQDNKLLRVETTIKNGAHWKTYNLKVQTFKDLLNLDLSKHLEIYHRPIAHYMDGQETILPTRTTFTLGEKKDLKLIELYVKLYKIKEYEAIDKLARDIEPTSKQNRYRYVKKLIKLTQINRVEKIIKKDEKQLNIIDELEKLKLIPKNMQ